MSQSIASVKRWPHVLPHGASRVATRPAARGSGRKALRAALGFLDDAVFLLLAVLLAPVAILAVGVPVALFIRLLLEIAERL